MSDDALWQRLAGLLSTSHLMARNRDPLTARLLKIEECSAIVTELRIRRSTLSLLAENPPVDTLDVFLTGMRAGLLAPAPLPPEDDS